MQTEPEFEEQQCGVEEAIALLPREHRLGKKVRKTVKDGCILISYWSASYTAESDMDTFATRIGSGELERFHGGMDAAQNDSIRRFFALP